MANDHDDVEALVLRLYHNLPQEMRDYMAETERISKRGEIEEKSLIWKMKANFDSFISTKFEKWLWVNGWPFLESFVEYWLDRFCMSQNLSCSVSFILGFGIVPLFFNARQREKRKESWMGFWRRLSTHSKPHWQTKLEEAYRYMRGIDFEVLIRRLKLRFTPEMKMVDVEETFRRKLKRHLFQLAISVLIPFFIHIYFPKFVSSLVKKEIKFGNLKNFSENQTVLRSMVSDQAESIGKATRSALGLAKPTNSFSETAKKVAQVVLPPLSTFLSIGYCFVQGSASALSLERKIIASDEKIYNQLPIDRNGRLTSDFSRRTQAILPLLPIRIKLGTVERFCLLFPHLTRALITTSHLYPLFGLSPYGNASLVLNSSILGLGTLSYVGFTSARYQKTL